MSEPLFRLPDFLSLDEDRVDGETYHEHYVVACQMMQWCDNNGRICSVLMEVTAPTPYRNWLDAIAELPWTFLARTDTRGYLRVGWITEWGWLEPVALIDIRANIYAHRRAALEHGWRLGTDTSGRQWGILGD